MQPCHIACTGRRGAPARSRTRFCGRRKAPQGDGSPGDLTGAASFFTLSLKHVKHRAHHGRIERGWRRRTYGAHGRPARPPAGDKQLRHLANCPAPGLLWPRLPGRACGSRVTPAWRYQQVRSSQVRGFIQVQQWPSMRVVVPSSCIQCVARPRAWRARPISARGRAGSRGAGLGAKKRVPARMRQAMAGQWAPHRQHWMYVCGCPHQKRAGRPRRLLGGGGGRPPARPRMRLARPGRALAESPGRRRTPAAAAAKTAVRGASARRRRSVTRRHSASLDAITRQR